MARFGRGFPVPWRRPWLPVESTTPTNVNVAGPVCALTLAAPAGSLGDGVAGPVCTLVLTAPAGTGDITVVGPVCGMTLAAPAGTPTVSINGPTDNLMMTAPAGTGDVTVPGAVCGMTLAAPAGAITFGPNGPVVNLALAAPAGTGDVTVPGAVSALALAAPAGTVVVGEVVYGPTVNLAIVAPPGGIMASANISGPVCTLSLAAPPGNAGVAPLKDYTPPVLQYVQPRFYDDDLPQQKALYKYGRPIDQPVNTFILSDDTVVTDYAVPILATAENGEATTSSTNIPYPWQPDTSPLVGPPEGAEGGPYGQPPPYSMLTSAVNPSSMPETTQFTQSVWVKYWFRGGVGTYKNLSANLISILENAGFSDYLSTGL